MSRKLSAQETCDFLDRERRRITGAYRELEEAQSAFQSAYVKFGAEHDRALIAAVAQVASRPAEILGATMRSQIAARLPVEQGLIAERRAVLAARAPALQAEADDLLAKAQREIAAQRALNPQLNEREEQLKADIAGAQQQLEALNAEIAGLARGLGFITHARRIHELDRARFKAVGRLEALNDELRTVRLQWKEAQAGASKNQADYQAQWQSALEQLGAVEQEREYLAGDPDSIARQRAIVYVLDHLALAPHDGDDAELQAVLEQMAALNLRTDALQLGLAQTAGMLGLMHGVDEGLRRFGESVQALIDEQQRHSAYLRPPAIALPDEVVAFGAAWDDLAAKTRDEKLLADHPADLAAALQPFLGERLAEARIKAYFDALGRALNDATAGWRGS